MENVVFIYGKKTKVVWNNEHLVSNKWINYALLNSPKQSMHRTVQYRTAHKLAQNDIWYTVRTAHLLQKKVNGSRIVERYFKNQLARWFKWSKEENRSLYNRMDSVNLCVASWIAYAILSFSQRVILRNAIGCQPDILYSSA